MRFPFIPRILVLLATAVGGAPLAVAQAEGPTPPALDERVALLFAAAQDPEKDFAAAYEAAQAAGVSESRLLEARIAHFLQARDLRGLLGLVEAIEAQRAELTVGFDPKGEQTHAFVSQRQIDGLLAALHAVQAYQEGNVERFERSAKEAFWEWPQWAQLFQLANLVQELRSREVIHNYVAGLVLPMDLPLRSLDGERVELGTVLEGHKAVLFDFWASWCAPCLRLMPELQERAESLPPQGVAVVAVNTDDEDPLAKAAAVKEERGMDLPWMVEAADKPFSGTLLIDSIPRMVLVAPDGRILFNGHPLDEELAEALATLGVELPAES